MKKNVKCIARTINLSQPKTCARPSQIRKLINADSAELGNPCENSSRMKKAYDAPCRPVPVRICTRIDMQKTLAPKACECPRKTPPETIGKKLARCFKNLIKSGIAAGSVYWTTVEGFWGDGQEAEGLYHRIMSTVAPAFEEAIDAEEINLPHIENMQHDLLDAYNRLILRFVGLVAVVPIFIEDKIQNFLFPCSTDDDGSDKSLGKGRGGG